MEANIFNQLVELKKSGNKTERKISQYLLEYEGEYRDMKLVAIAKATYTSNSSIVRYAKKLNLRGFPELKLELHNQAQFYLGSDNNQDEQVDDMHFNSIVNAFEKTRSITDNVQVDELINSIKNSATINLYAMGETSIVAQDFQLKLIRIGINATCYHDRHTQYFTAVNSSTSSMAIGVSYSMTTPEVLQNLKQAHEYGAKTYLVCKKGIKKPDFIDHVLHVEADESIARVFSTTSRFAMMFLFDMIYHKLINTDKDFYHQKLESTRIHRKRD